MVVVERYDPRKDKEAVKELFDDFIVNKSYFKSDWKKFEKELDKRVLDLKYRNATVVAKEDDKVVGFGTFTIFTDYLGNDRALMHQVMTKKEDTFKKGIEEAIYRELESYLKNTFNLSHVFYICPDSDSNKRSLFMKMGMKKDQHAWYIKEL